MSNIATKNIDLPRDWEWSTLGEVCEKPQYGWTTKATSQGRVKLLRTTDITKGAIAWGSVPFCSETPEDIEKYLLQDGDIVVSRAGSVGVSYLVTNPEPSVFASYLIRFKPLIERKYVFYFLQSPAYWSAISERSAGIALQNVNASKLRGIPIPVAPYGQQKRTVAKIEELFSHIDAGIVSLQKAKNLLIQFRQSVLKAAITGELTQDWREQSREKLSDPLNTISNLPDLPKPARWKTRSKETVLGHPALAVNNPQTELPKGWIWAPLVELATIASGHTPSRKHPEWWDGDICWIGIVDARENHGCVINETAQHTNEEGLANSASRLLPMGTVCVSRTASVGYVVIMGKEMATSQDFVNWIPTEAVTSDWLRLIFTADTEGLRKFGKGTVHKTIYFSEWLSINIALPSVEEQKKIVEIADSKINAMQRLESQIERQLKKAEQNKLSILKAAFSGELVDSLTTDGTAKDLLDKVEAQKTVDLTRQKVRKNKKHSEKKESGLVKKSIIDALGEAESSLTPEELFARTGRDHTSADEVEEFYVELKKRLGDNEISIDSIWSEGIKQGDLISCKADQ
ncbi:hypothetical protein CLH62_06340 [Marinobacter guineae]|uniref:Type I restriction modification DNA specificity domain-containing protein n=1 Tax=Marinobacter guineae TaxID=432303 RepID=A0A2G1VL14_9GAMM|nr:restriction endonuclease subunit S [Marinobacter guineae]PHQ27189.1 hypothetical protein CLH62_06340 [Marinobacter guineae]